MHWAPKCQEHVCCKIIKKKPENVLQHMQGYQKTSFMGIFFFFLFWSLFAHSLYVSITQDMLKVLGFQEFRTGGLFS